MKNILSEYTRFDTLHERLRVCTATACVVGALPVSLSLHVCVCDVLAQTVVGATTIPWSHDKCFQVEGPVDVVGAARVASDVVAVCAVVVVGANWVWLRACSALHWSVKASNWHDGCSARNVDVDDVVDEKILCALYSACANRTRVD